MASPDETAFLGGTSSPTDVVAPRPATTAAQEKATDQRELVNAALLPGYDVWMKILDTEEAKLDSNKSIRAAVKKRIPNPTSKHYDVESLARERQAELIAKLRTLLKNAKPAKKQTGGEA